MRSKGRRLRTPKRQLVWGSGYAPGTVLRIVSFFLCLFAWFFLVYVFLFVCLFATLLACLLCLLVCFIFSFCVSAFSFPFSLFLCIQTSSVTTDVARVNQLLALRCTKSQEQFQRLNHHVHPGNMEPENNPPGISEIHLPNLHFPVLC